MEVRISLNVSMHLTLTLKSVHVNQVAEWHDIVYTSFGRMCTRLAVTCLVGCFNFRIVKGSDHRIYVALKSCTEDSLTSHWYSHKIGSSAVNA